MKYHLTDFEPFKEKLTRVHLSKLLSKVFLNIQVIFFSYTSLYVSDNT